MSHEGAKIGHMVLLNSNRKAYIWVQLYCGVVGSFEWTLGVATLNLGEAKQSYDRWHEAIGGSRCGSEGTSRARFPSMPIYIYGIADIHYSLNLCQWEDLEVETDTSSSCRCRRTLLNAGRPCRSIQQSTTDVRHGDRYTQARRDSVQHYNHIDRL